MASIAIAVAYAVSSRPARAGFASKEIRTRPGRTENSTRLESVHPISSQCHTRQSLLRLFVVSFASRSFACFASYLLLRHQHPVISSCCIPSSAQFGRREKHTRTQNPLSFFFFLSPASSGALHLHMEGACLSDPPEEEAATAASVEVSSSCTGRFPIYFSYASPSPVSLS